MSKLPVIPRAGALSPLPFMMSSDAQLKESQTEILSLKEQLKALQLTVQTLKLENEKLKAEKSSGLPPIRPVTLPSAFKFTHTHPIVSKDTILQNYLDDKVVKRSDGTILAVDLTDYLNTYARQFNQKFSGYELNQILTTDPDITRNKIKGSNNYYYFGIAWKDKP